MALDPVHHVASKRSTSCDAAYGVDVREGRVDVVPCIHQIPVRVIAPVAGYCIGQVLTESCASRGVGCNDNVALVGPDFEIPSSAP